jgi:hypothetical protein
VLLCGWGSSSFRFSAMKFAMVGSSWSEVLSRWSGPWFQVSNRFYWVRPDHGEVRSGREAGGDLTSGLDGSPLRRSKEPRNHLLRLIGKCLLCAGEVGIPRAGIPNLDS